MGIFHVFWVPVFVVCIEVAKQNNVYLSCFVNDGLKVLIKNAGWVGRAIAASYQQRLVDPTVKFYWARANLNPQEF